MRKKKEIPQSFYNLCSQGNKSHTVLNDYAKTIKEYIKIIYRFVDDEAKGAGLSPGDGPLSFLDDEVRAYQIEQFLGMLLFVLSQALPEFPALRASFSIP
jgi:hypothetical protein